MLTDSALTMCRSLATADPSSTATPHDTVCSAGASFGGRSDVGGDAGLPSAPSFTRSVSVASSADQQPAGHALAPRYAPGRRVLYDAFDESEPVRGTVAKVDWQGAASAWLLWCSWQLCRRARACKVSSVLSGENADD
jgi:hypothetical protein